uniref:G-patch domain-containing protein n=1 Tax=Kalanchoe fedtschenkoi TaxID=63787 RepID=A0A7N0TJQ3_KALFE
MAERTEQSSEEPNQVECSFVWDEQSQLYYHARSGFYHDPSAGWYYSSTDGLYYKFEDGNYVLLKEDGPEDQMSKPSLLGNPSSEACLGNPESASNDDSDVPRPTSEWLEDTLIHMYLSGYSNPEQSADYDKEAPLDTQDADDAAGNEDVFELEEGEWIPDETDPCENESVAGRSWEEENWLAQYGQVTQPEDEAVTNISAVDLWDWETILTMRKDGKGQACRLIGRLVRRNTKLHPSMPTGGRLLKTAPISETHLDLIRVTTGQVYRLRNPSTKYLASLTVYDSSNPTKDWGFPRLSAEKPISPTRRSSGYVESETSSGKEKLKEMHKIAYTSEKNAHAYRDRAAERRNLHGGFGVGPGQKKTTDDIDSPSSPVSVPTEIAAAEALYLSFGAGSYSRKLLEKMGWKEGEGLGKTNKGLKEPLQAVQNKGNAGLGWS